jgi:phosphoglucomutase
VVRDYGRSVELDLAQGTSAPITLPQEDVIQWLTDQGSKVTIRPSGTEPKMKLYLGVRAGSLADARERLKVLEGAFDALVQRGLKKA